MLDQVQKYYNALNRATHSTIFQSKDNCHAKSLFSLVIGGTENGNLTRVFIAGEDIRPFDIQLHTHRYCLTITTLTNNIRHHTAEIMPALICDGPAEFNEYQYESPLNGGKGLTLIGSRALGLVDYDLPSLTQINMSSKQIHTVSCKAGAVWVVQEHGFVDQKHSFVYGEPFVVDGLYTPPPVRQINEKRNLVSNLLKEKIIKLQAINQQKETIS